MNQVSVLSASPMVSKRRILWRQVLVQHGVRIWPRLPTHPFPLNPETLSQSLAFTTSNQREMWVVGYTTVWLDNTCLGGAIAGV